MIFLHDPRQFLAGLPLVAALAAGSPRLAACQSAANETPAAWLQFRSDTVNAGVVPGSLRVTWQAKAPRSIRGLAIGQGVVVVGTESPDADRPVEEAGKDQRGFVLAMDATTGKVLWTRELSSWVHGDPVIYRDRVYVCFGRFPMLTPGGVVALDLKSGEQIWIKHTPTGIMPGPAVDTTRQHLIVAGGEGVLYELSLTDGSEQQAAGLRGWASMSSPRLLGSGNVFVAASSALINYSLPRGTIEWKYRAPVLHAMGDIPVAVNDSTVFITGFAYYGMWNAFRELPVSRFTSMMREAYRRNGREDWKQWFQQQWLLALHRRDGHVIWRAPLGLGIEVPRNSSGTPVLHGKYVLVSSPISQTIRAFDAATGALLWTNALDAMHKGALTVVGNDIWYGDKKGNVTMLALETGKMTGRCSAGSPFTVFAPVLVGETFFVATKDGTLNAVAYDDIRSRAVARQAGASCFGKASAQVRVGKS